MPVCHCQTASPAGRPAPSHTATRSAATLGLSVLIAFFPKCPMCWMAYTSWLGVAGLFQIPYMGYLYPVLVVLLAVHLLLLWKQSRKVGYGPLIMSLTGASALLLVRLYAPQVHWALNTGILLMLAGSVWHGVAMRVQRA